jgi:hypothetical protein
MDKQKEVRRYEGVKRVAMSRDAWRKFTFQPSNKDGLVE